MDNQASAAIGALAGATVVAVTAVVVAKIRKKDNREEQLEVIRDAEQNAYCHGWYDGRENLLLEQMNQREQVTTSF